MAGGEECCPASNECCSEGYTCCGGLGCCPVGHKCCQPSMCCPEDGTCCDGLCCHDGNPCTEDVCENGVCVYPPVPCPDDGNPCTDDYCVGGECTHPSTYVGCNDGDDCTLYDQCSESYCSGTPDPGCAWPSCPGQFVVDGEGQGQGVVYIRSSRMVIPQGTACVGLRVYYFSTEYPEYTGNQSEYNDRVSFLVSYPNGVAAIGSIRVNSLHGHFGPGPYPGGNFLVIEQELDFSVLTAEGPSWMEFRGSTTNVSDGRLGSGVAIEVQCPQNYDIVEVQYKTFIHCEVAGPTTWDPTLYDYFAGDNRSFGYTFSVNKSRTYQLARLTMDPAAAGGWVLAPLQRSGISRGYDNESWSDVAPMATPTCGGQCAYTFLPSATAECTAQVADPVGNGLLDMTFQRISSSEVEIYLWSRAADQCEWLVPSVGVDLHLRLRQVCNNGVLGPLEYKASGRHDGYPWHEFYLNGTSTYTHDPCLTGDGPWSMFAWPIGRQYQFELQQPLLQQWRPVP